MNFVKFPRNGYTGRSGIYSRRSLGVDEKMQPRPKSEHQESAEIPEDGLAELRKVGRAVVFREVSIVDPGLDQLWEAYRFKLANQNKPAEGKVPIGKVLNVSGGRVVYFDEDSIDRMIRDRFQNKFADPDHRQSRRTAFQKQVNGFIRNAMGLQDKAIVAYAETRYQSSDLARDILPPLPRDLSDEDMEKIWEERQHVLKDRELHTRWMVANITDEQGFGKMWQTAEFSTVSDRYIPGTNIFGVDLSNNPAIREEIRHIGGFLASKGFDISLANPALYLPLFEANQQPGRPMPPINKPDTMPKEITLLPPKALINGLIAS